MPGLGADAIAFLRPGTDAVLRLTLRAGGGTRARRVRLRPPEARRIEHVGETEEPDRGTSCKEVARYDQGTVTGEHWSGANWACTAGWTLRPRPTGQVWKGEAVSHAPGDAGRRFYGRVPASRPAVAAVDDRARHRTQAPARGAPPPGCRSTPSAGAASNGRPMSSQEPCSWTDGRRWSTTAFTLGRCRVLGVPKEWGRPDGPCDRTTGPAEGCSLLTPPPQPIALCRPCRSVSHFSRRKLHEQ